MSLPAVERTTLENAPASVPYLSAPGDRLRHWHSRLGTEKQGPRVGLVWAGASYHLQDRWRSIRLKMLRPLLEIPGVRWFGLQKGSAAKESLDLPASIDFESLDSELQTFTDTAAAIAALDLVITVDTSIAHLAGAMGRPVWTLLPFSPDYRWMLDRNDSPWYPTMRLWRQTRRSDWSGVIEAVRAALSEFPLPLSRDCRII
jgi:ADP-heptose:LPS heptosyltransferase